MGGVLEEISEGHVRVLKLNRPERLHAINRELADAMVAALERAEDDDQVRAVVVTGCGDKAFCAGQDMLEATGVEPGAAGGGTSSAYRAVERFQASPLPLIAAINGYCFGGGALLAIACDIRLAAEHATFRLPGAAYGLVVGAAMLPRLVGAARAKELIFTARRFDAERALTWGLLNHVLRADELLPAALTMAHEIAENSATAVRESKRIIDLASIVEHAVTTENAINSELRGSEEQSARFRTATHAVTGR
jgi:enoyl-CoA hydratase/carnithine racemase